MITKLYKQENTDNAPILILEGSKQPYLSVGRHYGGVKAFGYEYLFFYERILSINSTNIKKMVETGIASLIT